MGIDHHQALNNQNSKASLNGIFTHTLEGVSVLPMFFMLFSKVILVEYCSGRNRTRIFKGKNLRLIPLGSFFSVLGFGF